MQSVATVATTASDLISAADITADHDDSVMTTASTMTQGGKKTTRGRKATTGKGRKTKAKKEEDIEILEDEPQMQEPPELAAERGRKRASDAMEDSAATKAEEPAPKKRTMRIGGSNAADTSLLPDMEMDDAVPAKRPVGGKNARASTAKASRKTSQASVRSQASAASLRANLPDDDELERQLEADLDRYRSDVEDVAAEKPSAPVRGRPKKVVTARKPSSQRQKTQGDAYAMFDPTPAVPDEADIEAEFDALQAEMGVDQPSTETLVVPKKGRKAGTRKASKQTKKAKAAEPKPGPAVAADEAFPEELEPQQEMEPKLEPEREPEAADDPDLSTGTVVTKPASRPSIENPGRGRPSKKSTSSQAAVEHQKERRSSTAQAKSQPEEPSAQESRSTPKSTPAKIPRKPVPVASQSPASTQLPAPATESISAAQTPARAEKTLAAPPSSANQLPYNPPSIPRTRTVPSGRANNQAIVSPSQSAQSSSVAAENWPRPALQPAASVIPKRVVLGPISQQMQTPLRGGSSSSPSKRNIVAGLQSTTPWQPADLDLLFLSSSPAKSYDGGDGDEDKENVGGGSGGHGVVARLLRKGAELTTPEKRMTVEEWIYHNAGLAEQKLKRECEAMVSAFEREGCRALRVLEGLVVE